MKLGATPLCQINCGEKGLGDGRCRGEPRLSFHITSVLSLIAVYQSLKTVKQNDREKLLSKLPLAECGVISASDPFSVSPYKNYPQQVFQLPPKPVKPLQPWRMVFSKSGALRRCHRKTNLSLE